MPRARPNIQSQAHAGVPMPLPAPSGTDGFDSVLRELRELRELLHGRLKPWHTVEEIAHHVGRSAYTVRRWVAEGRLRAIRVDGTGPRGRLLIPREEVDRLVRQGGTPAGRMAGTSPRSFASPSTEQASAS